MDTSMRVAHYLTRGETGRYYVRLRIPADLQARFGRKVVKRSTGTACDRAALGYALLMQQRYARAFAAIRNGSMGSELDELLRSLEGTSSLELILKDVKLPGGASFGQVEINDDKDLSLFRQLAAQHSVPAPAPFPALRVVKPISEARSAGLTLAAARDKYLVSIQGKNTAKTIVQKTRAMKDLEVFVASQRKGKGKRPVMLKELTRTDFSEWFLHETAQKRVITYITNRFSACADFIKWAQTAGHYPQGDNPASGHASVPRQLKKQRAKSHGSQAFTPDQVKRIFDPENFKQLKGEAARWLPLILLYTGARSNEVARLELEDCREEGGIPIFHFT
ncbi:DUF6538 domain-containing protein [Xanthomonas translucens]|uniref:DUF6538 domain-containing protein n=2 Tax=Xanthomonas campestris pv. translucens TaxID=343 RepID=UPI001F5047EC|nr:DUF6538 domain-containing protein [Xanthomonas translucens]